MDKKIIITLVVVLFLFLVMLGLLFLRGPIEREIGIEESRLIAKQGIVENSPTYLYDGYNLQLESEEVLEEGRIYSFVFSFESRFAGYGDRTDELLAQVITPHTMEVIVDRGVVVEAITDGVYDEIKGEELDTTQIIIYLVEVVDGQEQLARARREVPAVADIERMAINELLKGALPHEEMEGLTTLINKETRIWSIEVEDVVAYVDFNEKLEEDVAGSAQVTIIRDQITKTLMEFDHIDEVVISINGERGGILQP